MGKQLNWRSWKKNIDDAIANVCIQILKEPLLYFSEADIQQLLVEELRKIVPLSELYPTGVPKGKNSKGVYKTSLIHREYGGSEGTRLDVVVLNPIDIKCIDRPDLTMQKQKDRYVKPVYAFELGTEKTKDAVEHFRKDIEKLKRRVLGTGYIIHFYRDTTQSRTGSERRGNTERKIERVFKQAFTNGSGHAHIKTLAILVRTYRDQERMRGKCEIFNGIDWKQVNISRDAVLREAIIKQLD